MSQISCSNPTILHLSLIPSIGPAVIEKIRAALKDTNWAMLYDMSAYDLQMRFALTSAAAQKIVQGLADHSLLEQELQLIAKHAIQVLTIEDEAYPELLSPIHLPPPVLYVQGSVDLLSQNLIGMVGSRLANRYAQRAIDALVPPLVAHGFGIVSGGARGADSMAHEATVQAQGKTIAVLGSGLLQHGSSTQQQLLRRILAHGGAVISPFPLLLPADEGTFPARNRIIAGLAQAVIVIQAALKSGASITAHYALEQGREVGIVPGDIFDPLSAGCHALARQGAAIITSAADILELVGLSAPVESAEMVPAMVANIPHDPILQACRVPQSFDQLLVATGLSPADLQDKLFALSLEGYIVQNGAGLWANS